MPHGSYCFVEDLLRFTSYMGHLLVPMPLLLPFLSGPDSLLRMLSACALRSDFCGHDQLTCLCLNLRHRVSDLLVLSRLRCALRSLDQLTALS